jgi:uncharacterized iron-regulated protein
MPKLSEHTLEKMFPCDYCGEFLRTRQGLSGHIQWKHKVGKKPKYTDYNYLISWAKYFKSVRVAAGVAASEIGHHIRIALSWPGVVSVLDSLKIQANDQDFKHYLISSLAYMHESQELEERLINRIRTLFDEYKLTS